MDRQKKDSAEYEISKVDIIEYLPKIYETASKCLNDPELVQDAVGEVYERLSRQPKVYTRDKLSAYIDVTTRNMCSTLRKRKYRLAARAILFSRLESATASQNTPLAEFLAGPAVRPDEVAAMKEKLALVRSAIITAILKLNTQDFDILMRRYFADKPETIESKRLPALCGFLSRL